MSFFDPSGELLPLPPDCNYFDYMIGSVLLALDGQELNRRFHALSRQVHPDRFAMRGADQQALSVAHAEFLNQAYRTLKDPIERVRYFLWLSGHGLPEDKRVPVALAETYFELQELLAEADGSGEDEREEILAQLAGLRGQVAGIEETLLNRLQEGMQAWDRQDRSPEALLGELARTVADLSYARAMRRDLDTKFQRKT